MSRRERARAAGRSILILDDSSIYTDIYSEDDMTSGLVSISGTAHGTTHIRLYS